MKLKEIYTFDKKELTFKKDKKIKRIFILLSIFSVVSFVFNIVMGVEINSSNEMSFSKNELVHIPLTKENIEPSRNKVWIDSTFTDYEKRAAVYLSRPEFTGTPLNAKMMTLCARNTYDSTGTLVPVELALLQAQIETSMGRAGRSPENNPFNVGETSKGTTMWFNSTFEGTQAYFFLIAKNYLRCKTVEELLMNFSNCSGHRYAEEEYEIKVSSEYIRIKNWINRNI
jgi:hypothetical protein